MFVPQYFFSNGSSRNLHTFDVGSSLKTYFQKLSPPLKSICYLGDFSGLQQNSGIFTGFLACRFEASERKILRSKLCYNYICNYYAFRYLNQTLTQ